MVLDSAASLVSCIPFHARRWCTLVSAGQHFRIVASKKPPHGATIQKLSADEYVVVKSGEIRQFKHNSNSRMQDPRSMRRSITQLRDIINVNCTADNSLFVTLTYAENMTDTGRLKTDFNAFSKRLQRYCKAHGIPYKGYIAACEPQARGAWHVHLLTIFEPWKPFLPHSDIASLWGHGFIKIQSLNDCDNIGAYLSAYLTNLCMDDETPPDGKPKRIVKGQRLTMYPVGFHPFRWSRNLLKPTTTAGDYDTLSEQIPDDCHITYQSHKVITDDHGEEVNAYWYEHYSTARR